MSEFSRHNPSRRLSSSMSVFSWSKAREAEFLTQKMNSRMVELEKDGTKVINNLGKLSNWVEKMIEDVKINVEILKTKEDMKKIYQEVSQVLLFAEDSIAMLAASLFRWQISEVDSDEKCNVTSNIDKSGKYLATEFVSSHQVAGEGVVKESMKNVSGQKNQHNCESETPMIGDENNLPDTEKSISSVVFVSNLDPEFMDCDRLFNLFSQYATVKRIQVLKMEFRNALVELSNKEGANRVIYFLKDSKCFNQRIKINPSSKWTVKQPHSILDLPNGTKAFKEFSDDESVQYPHHRLSSTYSPSRTVYFYRTPKMTDEEFYEIFERLKAPLPYKVMWFPNKIPMGYPQYKVKTNFGGGCLQFKSKDEALKAICIVNHSIIERLNAKIHLAFTYERKDHCFTVPDKNSDKDNNTDQNDKNGEITRARALILEKRLNDELVSKAGFAGVASPKLIYQDPELMELASSPLSKLLPPDLKKIANEIPSIVKIK